MSDNNNKGDKDELTGPYYTLSVADRTKALGLVPGTSPGIIGNILDVFSFTIKDTMRPM